MRKGASVSQTGPSQQAAEPMVSALAGFDPSRSPGLFPLNGFAPGNYCGTCYSCGRVVYDIAKRATCCFPCAVLNLKDYHERVEGALRIRLWNESKKRGQSDRAAMQHIHDTLHAIATEARRAETTGSVEDEGAARRDRPNPVTEHPQ